MVMGMHAEEFVVVVVVVVSLRSPTSLIHLFEITADLAMRRINEALGSAFVVVTIWALSSSLRASSYSSTRPIPLVLTS